MKSEMYTDLCVPSASPDGSFPPFRRITFHNPSRPFTPRTRIIQLCLCIVQSDFTIVSFTHLALCSRHQALFPLRLFQIFEKYTHKLSSCGSYEKVYYCCTTFMSNYILSSVRCSMKLQRVAYPSIKTWKQEETAPNLPSSTT